MIPLLRSFVHELLYSPEAVRVWLRSFLAWAATVGGQVVAAGPDQIREWTVKDWAVRFGIAAVAAGAMLVKAGEKNAPEKGP